MEGRGRRKCSGGWGWQGEGVTNTTGKGEWKAREREKIMIEYTHAQSLTSVFKPYPTGRIGLPKKKKKNDVVVYMKRLFVRL